MEVLPAEAAAEPYCYLETVGRVSGRVHTVEMWFAAAGTRLYLMSGGRDRSDWVRNLMREPRVWVRVGTTIYNGEATLIEGTAEEQSAREALAAKYCGWRGGPLPNEWARRALPVGISLVGVAK